MINFRKGVGFFCFAVLWLVLVYLYYQFSTRTRLNSDDFANVFQALDIIHGNYLLRGWSLPPDTFFLMDTHVDVALLLLGFSVRTVAHLTPAVIYGTLVLSVFYVSWRILPFQPLRVAAICTVVFIVPVTGLIGAIISQSPFHVLTIVCAVWVFYFFAVGRKVWLWVAALILFIANSGDPYSLYVVSLPVCLTCALAIFIDGVQRRAREFRVLVIVIGVAALSVVFRRLIEHVGGFYVNPSTIQFVAVDDLGKNILLYLSSVLEIFQANLFGLAPASSAGVYAAVHFGFVVLFVAATLLVARKLRSVTPQTTRTLVVYMLMSLVIISAAFVLSTIPVGIWAARFLLIATPVIPIVFAIGLSILLAAMSRNQRVVTLCVLGLLGAFFVHFAFFKSGKHADYSPEIAVVDYLEQHGLLEGLAPYWDAGRLTAISDNKVKIRQIVMDQTGSIRPFDWLSSRAWYGDAVRPQFVVFSAPDFGVDEQLLTKTLGAPATRVMIDGYTILTWERPIAITHSAR